MGGAAVVAVAIPLLGMAWIAVARAGVTAFAPKVDVPLGPPGCDPPLDCAGSPFAVASGDLDGDGHADLATANNASADVSILGGDGRGAFAFARALDAGDQPVAIALGRLDPGDRVDVVVANEASDTLSVFLATDGGFAPAATIDLASASTPGDNPPSDLLLADVNGDGHLDAIATSLAGNKLTVLLGNGDGTFADPRVTELEGGPLQLAVGDLDGAGGVDLAVSLHDTGAVAVLLGDGEGSFALSDTLDVGECPTGVAIADFDRDHRMDIAVASELDDLVSVLLGTGGGAFTARDDYDVGASPEALAVADFDGDGRLDLASADNLGTPEIDSTVSVLSGLGDGKFAAARMFAAGEGAFDVIAADVNADRKPDVVTANMENADVSVLLNTAEGPAFDCPGDCNADGVVSIDELVTGVSASLDPARVAICEPVDRDGDGRAGVDELVRAVRSALSGCGNDGTV